MSGSFSGALFPSVCFCPTPMCWFSFTLIVFYYYTLEACSFSKKRNGADLDGRGGVEALGRVEGRETIIKINEKDLL